MVVTRLVNLENSVSKLLAGTEQGVTVAFQDVDFDLPLSTLDQFADLRTWLENQENFDKLVQLVKIYITYYDSPHDV